MAFSSRGDGSLNPWKDRTLEIPANKTKRKITGPSNNSQVVDFIKNEGKSYNTGTPFNASNMINLENRIAQGFNAINNLISPSVILNRFYPIGIIYTSFDSTNPANVLGGGTWIPIGDGTQGPLMCGDMTGDMIDRNTNAVNPITTENNNNQVLSLSASIGIEYFNVSKAFAEIPSHQHTFTDYYVAYGGYTTPCAEKYVDTENSKKQYMATWNKNSGVYLNFTNFAGDSGGHTHGVTIQDKQAVLNNISVNIEKPAVTVYCWVRTA